MERYQLKNHGTVIDTKTGLQWEAKYSGPMNWKSAMDLPAKLNAERFGGHDDWRLPPIKELFSLIDYERENPATTIPGGMASNGGTWSSTTPVASAHVGTTRFAWVAFFADGGVNIRDISVYANARCVRGGPLD